MAYIMDEKRKYQREWVANNRASYLAGKACAVCGSTDRLEVDHIDPGQKITHRIWSWSAERRAQELAKCQILCATHHKEKTRADRPTPEHGTVARYSSRIHACRCQSCKAANAAAKRERVERQRQAAYSQAA